MKRCTKCGIEKPVEEFHVRRDRPCGRVPRCRQCANKPAPRYVHPAPGERFGRLTVVGQEPGPSRGQRRMFILCACDCGGSAKALPHSLRAGKKKSCGCLSAETSAALVRAMNTTHGHAPKGNVSPEYRVWRGIIQRCENPNCKTYRFYGIRGIKLCLRWRESFAAFLEDVGPRPSPAHSLDRWPNNDGNYEPGNVRWATATEQARNRRSNHNVVFRGETKTLTEWAEIVGVPMNVVHRRLKNGWAVAVALETPVLSHVESGRRAGSAPRRPRGHCAKSRIIEINGVRRTVTEWARATGGSAKRISSRLRLGWDPARAVAEPAMPPMVSPQCRLASGARR